MVKKDKKKEEIMENHVVIDRKSEFINQLKGKTKGQLKNEWQNLSTVKPKEPTTIAFDEEELKETNKNRYDGIKCIDDHRVILLGEGGSYIHANFINDSNGQKMFLATQGPTIDSAKDMWRMIVQKQADTIIMLCCPIEMDYDKKAKKQLPKEKSVQYWPSNAKEVFDYEDIKSKFISYEEFQKQRGKHVRWAIQYFFNYYLFIQMIEEETGEIIKTKKTFLNNFIKV